MPPSDVNEQTTSVIASPSIRRTHDRWKTGDFALVSSDGVIFFVDAATLVTIEYVCRLLLYLYSIH